MAVVQRNKRRRVYSFEPNAVAYTSFSQKYMTYLLPALLQATSVSSHSVYEDKETEKKVRHEVDMALVLSADGFQWSRALKHKLEQGTNFKHGRSTTAGVLLTVNNNRHFSTVEEFKHLLPSAPIPKTIVPVEATRPRRVHGRRNCKMEEELACHVRILRRILPGGSDMDMCELLSEVESYVICLRMQVNILRSLVAADRSFFSVTCLGFRKEEALKD